MLKLPRMSSICPNQMARDSQDGVGCVAAGFSPELSEIFASSGIRANICSYCKRSVFDRGHSNKGVPNKVDSV